MKRMAVYSALAALLAGGVVLAAGLRPTGAERSDCPGRIECPLTGELVCADECPLAEAPTTDGALPPCCRGKQ